LSKDNTHVPSINIPTSTSPRTSASDEFAHLNSLAAQLTGKIKELKVKAASKVPTKTPA